MTGVSSPTMAGAIASPRRLADRKGWGLIASAAAMAIGGAAYVLGPILDERIPVVFRHIDWITYSSAAERFLHGQPLYVASQLTGPYHMANVAGIGYVYPPPSILLFVPFLALGPTLWALANALLFASGLAAMAHRDFGRFAALAFGIELLVVGVTAPYLDAMVMGNITLGLAGVLAWTWALGRGSRPIGLLAGLGGLVKLYPFWLVGWTRPPRARRTIGIALATTLGLIALTLPFVGVGSWVDYARAAANARPLCGYGIDAVACTLTPSLGALATPVLLAASGVLVLAAIWCTIDSLAFALIAVAVLLPLPEVFTHTFLLVEVLAIAMVGTLVRRRVPSGGDVSSTVDGTP
jgi:hypothetical protein